jgi:hypothetical protein
VSANATIAVAPSPLCTKDQFLFGVGIGSCVFNVLLNARPTLLCVLFASSPSRIRSHLFNEVFGVFKELNSGRSLSVHGSQFIGAEVHNNFCDVLFSLWSVRFFKVILNSLEYLSPF